MKRLLAVLVWSFVFGIFVNRAFAQTECSAVSIASPAGGSTVSGTVTLGLSYSCSNWPASTGFVRLEIVNPPWHIDGAPGVDSLTLDTIGMPNGPYQLYVTLWVGDAEVGGPSNAITVTVSNGGASPTPEPTATYQPPPPTPTPTPTATSSACSATCYGNVPTGYCVTNCACSAPSPSPTPAPDPTPSPAPIGGAPMRANDFLNSMGVTTHLVLGYDTEAQIIAGLQYLGIRHWRSNFTNDPNLLNELCKIHSATGATIDMLPYPSDPTGTIQTSWDPLASCGALFAVEGANEPNNFNFSYNGALCSQNTSFVPCAEMMRDLYRQVRADPKLANLPVFAMTEPGAEPDNAGLQFITIPPGAGTLMPDGTTFADFANLHNYVRCNGCSKIVDNQAWNAESTGAGSGPWDGIDGEFINQTFSMHYPAMPFSSGPDLPKVTTETGWATDGSITQDQQGKLFVNLYLSAVKRGWAYTFIYQLFDDHPGGGGYGLFVQSATLTPKLSATYIRNLTTILADDDSAFAPTPLSYSISGKNGYVHDLLMQKSDGRYELAVWGDQVVGESDNVTVNLPSVFSTVNIYDVTKGSSPVRTLKNVSAVPLTMTDHALILEFF